MRVLIAAGGTAGHINPALAIANYIKERQSDAVIAFAGRREGMEYGLVTKQGYPFYHIEVQGIQRSISPHNIVRNVKALWHLSSSGVKSRKILKDFQPDLVIGTGGYVSGPVLLAASKAGIRTAVHEQNAFPGVTNKILAKHVDLVFAAMPDAVSKLGAQHKTIVTGNPVRSEIIHQTREEARKTLGIPEDKIVLLSFGGSLGARRINEVVADLAAWHVKKRNFTHLHATGSYGKELFATLSRERALSGNPHLRVSEYINDMARYLAAADLVISRSGAITISELAAAGRASILIPSPNVAENHQYYNALELANAGAAVLIEEKDLTSELLIEKVDELTSDRATLRNMGIRAKACAHLNSLDKIYVYLMRLMRGELDLSEPVPDKNEPNSQKTD